MLLNRPEVLHIPRPHLEVWSRLGAVVFGASLGHSWLGGVGIGWWWYRRKRCCSLNHLPIQRLSASPHCALCDVELTLLVPLYSVQIDSSISTLSPKLYGKGGPCAMAEATADLRKFIPMSQSLELLSGLEQLTPYLLRISICTGWKYCCL